MLLFASVILITSCSEYNKVLKSTNYRYKCRKAFEYYNKKDWTRAQALFEEVLPLVRMTDSGEMAYYAYCRTHYNVEEYFLAGYYFKNFSKLYPGSERAEECLYMSGICNLKGSPRYSLDQTETYAAIKDFQAFLDRYPTSAKKDTCNKIIDELYLKLEEKAFEGAKLYYKIQNFKSASIALNSMLNKYPNTRFKEEALYLIIAADYKLAINSIESKKIERFEQTIKSYLNFVTSFPESKMKRDAERYYNLSADQIKNLKEN